MLGRSPNWGTSSVALCSQHSESTGLKNVAIQVVKVATHGCLGADLASYLSHGLDWEEYRLMM